MGARFDLLNREGFRKGSKRFRRGSIGSRFTGFKVQLI
jgi:hypothetical protein